jgi:hypothetical protein
MLILHYSLAPARGATTSQKLIGSESAAAAQRLPRGARFDSLERRQRKPRKKSACTRRLCHNAPQRQGPGIVRDNQRVSFYDSLRMRGAGDAL